MIRCLLILFLTITSWLNLIGNEQRDQIEKQLQTATDTTKVKLLNELARLYCSIDLNHADSLAQVCFNYLQQVHFPVGQVRNYNNLCFINSSLGNFDTATYYITQAILLAEELDNSSLLAACYHEQFILRFRQGHNDMARISAKKSLAIAKEIVDKPTMAKSYEHLGILSGLTGGHAEAIEYFLESFSVFEELNDTEGASRILNNIGHTFELAGNYNKALEYLRKSLANKKETDRYGIGWSLVNIGVVHSRLNDTDSALHYYQLALIEAEVVNDLRLTLTCLDNIGGKYSLMRDFDKSNHYLQRAFILSNESGQNARRVYILGNLAENYIYLDKLDSARIYAEEQLELALAANLTAEQKDAYDNLSRIYSGLGDFEAAYDALEHYVAVNDSVFSQQKSEQIEALRESFETDRKEQEIANLTTSNESARFRNRAYAIAAICFLIIGALLFYTQRLRTLRKEEELSREKELDEMKSKFFANISHEFRTPLTLILSPLDELIDKVRGPGIADQLSVLKRNANRLLQLVNQLLDLSKIDSGKLTLEVRSCQVFPILSGVSKSYDTLAEQNDIRLELKVPNQACLMGLDREKFETIITNVISNAFKFTPDGGTVMISGKILPDEVLEIIVEDTGPGFKASDLENIFDRFYMDGSTDQAGSGIGLALAKELVELHSGQIEACNRPDSGAAVTIRIPTTLPVDQDLPIENFETPVSKVEGTAMGQLNGTENLSNDSRLPVMLIIEDHQEVRSYLQQIFMADFHLTLAEDGKEGIEQAMLKIPDIVISDVMMPKKKRLHCL